MNTKEKKSPYEEQARNFLMSCGAKMTISRSGIVDRFPNEKTSSGCRWRYRVRIVRAGVGSWSFYFYGSIADYLSNTDPGKYDVLSCVQKYDVGTFADFCSDFGYDTEPLSEYKRVMRIYNAARKEFANVQRIFGDVIAELEKIQ